MIVVIFINYLNHHQLPVADAFYELLGDNFRFVATLPRNVKELKGGIDYSNRPYCILAGESEEDHARAIRYSESADVCVFGACSQEYAVHRAKFNPSGLSFECGERWLKRGLLNIVSPVLRQWWLNYMRYYRKANFYKLCASAFAAHDDNLLGCYKGRCFKWGYFTEVSSDDSGSKYKVSNTFNENIIDKHETDNRRVRLMWCARFIDWKHPNLAIECAKMLKDDGVNFELHMYGDGELRRSMEQKAESLKLTDNVKFHGNVPNSEIKHAMHESDIFLFTSDRREGWGAVANEAMAAGCCLIAGDKLGAAPYLIHDGINGFMYRDKDAKSLYMITKHAINNPDIRVRLSRQAQNDMTNLWSPKHAAESLLKLIYDLQNSSETSIIVGPCSKA